MKKIASIILCITLLCAFIVPFASSATPFEVTPNEPVQMKKSSPVIDGVISVNEGWSRAARLDESTVGYYGGTKSLLTGSGNMFFTYSDEGLCFAMDYTDPGDAYCVRVYEYGDNVGARTIVVADPGAKDYRAAPGCFPSALPDGSPVDYYVYGYSVMPELDKDIPYALAYWFSTGEKDMSNSLRYCDENDYIDGGETVWNGDVFILTLDPGGVFNSSGKGNRRAPGYAIGIAPGDEVKVASIDEKDNSEILTSCRTAGHISPDRKSMVFEVMIPWSVIIEDYNAFASRVRVDHTFTEDELKSVDFRACVKFYDRYFDGELGDNDNIGLFIVEMSTKGYGHSIANMGLVLKTQSESGGGQDDPEFHDVPDGAWYTDAVFYCYKNGLMTGTANGYFSPGMTVTRAQAVQVLAKLDGADLKDYESETPFNDVEKGRWYAAAAAWAKSAGVASGYSNGNFGPDDPVTREQLAVFMRGLAGHMGYAVETDIDINSVFRDAPDVHGWAVSAIAWAYANGIMSGNVNGQIMPLSTATRAQFAVMARKFVTG